MTFRRLLLCFTHDLRIHDNQALLMASERAYEFSCIYCVDKSWTVTRRFDTRHMGDHRWLFLSQSLRDLQSSLHALGHPLNVLHGDTEAIIATLIQNHGYDALVYSQHFGWN